MLLFKTIERQNKEKNFITDKETLHLHDLAKDKESLRIKGNRLKFIDALSTTN